MKKLVFPTIILIGIIFLYISHLMLSNQFFILNVISNVDKKEINVNTEKGLKTETVLVLREMNLFREITGYKVGKGEYVFVRKAKIIYPKSFSGKITKDAEIVQTGLKLDGEKDLKSLRRSILELKVESSGDFNDLDKYFLNKQIKHNRKSL